MAVDQSIEKFTYALFNRLWSDYNIIDKPLNFESVSAPVGNILIEDMVQAVKVRQVLFRSCYQALFDNSPFDFTTSVSDFHMFLVSHFRLLIRANNSTMEHILTACAFVAEMSQYAYSKNDETFIHFSYLICAMFIEYNFLKPFYSEGGFWSLTRACQSYITPFAFIKQHSETITSPYGKNSISFSLLDCWKSVCSLERCCAKFLSRAEDGEDYSLTKFWVYHCINDLNETDCQTKDFTTFRNISVEQAEVLLDKLKFYCDPAGSTVALYDDLINFAKRCGRDPTELMTAYLHFRPFDRIWNPHVPAAKIHALKQRVIYLISPILSPGNRKNQSDDQKYEEVLALFSTLSMKNKHSAIRTFGMESQFGSKHSSFPPNILIGSSDDGTTRFTNSDTTKARSNENESFPSCVQTSEIISPMSDHESPNPPNESLYQEDIDLMNEFLSQLRKNSSRDINSPNYSRNSDVMKDMSGGVDTPSSQVLEKLHSPKTFNKSSETPKSRKNKKNEDQITGLLSHLDINSLSPDEVNVSPNCSPSSGVNKKRSEGKENSPSTVQILKNGFIPRKSSSTVKNSEGKKNESITQTSNLNIDNLLRDDTNISPKYSSTKKEQPYDPDHCDMTTVDKDSSLFPVSLQKRGGQKTVAEVSLNTSTKVSSPGSSRKAEAVSVGNTIEVEMEIYLKTARSATTSQNPSGTETGSSNASFGTRKSKTKTKSEMPPKSILTRRQQLLETEENAKDVLRMIHVLGNETSLEIMKSVLKQ